MTYDAEQARLVVSPYDKHDDAARALRRECDSYRTALASIAANTYDCGAAVLAQAALNAR